MAGDTAKAATALAQVDLDDKYTLDDGRIFLTGVQALVRLPLMQKRRDAAAGKNTSGFISGYRGSPLGGYDQQIWRAKKHMKSHDIHFQPGVNEELAATACWGSQQTNLYPGAKFDGTFAIWYGKGPGVDRSGDVFKHATFAGTAPWGGVLAMAGDDHVSKSSTLPHQSEFAFLDASVPVLNPAGVQDTLDFGLFGIALSRFAGVWVGFKTTAEIMDSTASVDAHPDALEITIPTDFEMPEGGLNIRWPDPWLEQEERLHIYKYPAVHAFVRANAIDNVVIDSTAPKLTIVTTGKSYLDVRQALDDLGIDDALAEEIGLRVYKVGMPWPLEPTKARAACAGSERVLVVEEKRALIEWQLKEQLYALPEGQRPKIEGKTDLAGKPLFKVQAELLATDVALAIADRILEFADVERIKARRALIRQRVAASVAKPSSFARTPYFCSGCPHNTSTRVPEGSRAAAGIGCHFMANWMPERNTSTFTQMGGEGANWVGQAPFTETKHIFANLGDGTYNHSGILAIRQAVAANTTMTYKILFNDAVAMTGGQPSDNGLTPWVIAQQVAAEGVNRVEVVTDDPDKYPLGTAWPANSAIHHRDDLDQVQRDLRESEGVTVLLYDQTCAAEKRRRRKRGTMEDPNKRIFINERVCEGCGDCGEKSNCVSILPVETEFGRKRQIDQSSCNKDYSCVKGFCPSFVNVIGGKVRKAKAEAPARAERAKPDLFEALPDPKLPSLDEPYGILVTGIGGTGVVTIGALLGMAAHLEGKGTSILDMTGLAQKGGSVMSHVKIAKAPENLHAVRIATGSADLMLACDIATAVSKDGLSLISQGKTSAVVNTQQTMTGRFTQNADEVFPGEDMKQLLRQQTGENSTMFLDANRLATRLLGDSIASNLFMLGYAWQMGLVPLSREAIERAIELNGVAIDFNKQAFLWGRRAAHDLPAVERIVEPKTEAEPARTIAVTLDEIVAKRVAELTAYQDAAYADRYRQRVARIAAAEQKAMPGSEALAVAAARYLHKLMAIKDEYEVARLYTDGGFLEHLNRSFEGNFRLEFNMAPPLIAPRDPQTGHLKKLVFGPWMLKALGLVARMKGLRGGKFDLFGRTDERRMERRILAEYEALLDEIAESLTADTHATALELASLPEHIRGYGHVREKHITTVKAQEADLLARFRNPEMAKTAAE